MWLRTGKKIQFRIRQEKRIAVPGSATERGAYGYIGLKIIRI
jgi:hypothetical protein